MPIKKNYIVMKLLNIEHLRNQYYYLNYNEMNNEIMKKENLINSNSIKKNYIVISLINIEHLLNQYFYLKLIKITETV